MLKMTPWAPSTVVSSSGEAIAFCAACAVLAAALADAHHRRTGIGHDRLDVGKIQVDETRLRDQVADAGDTLAQNVVGVREGLVQRGLLLDHLQDALVGDGNQRVNLSFEFGDAVLGDLHALLALERKGLGDDGDRQRARLSGELRDDRRSAGTGSATHAGGQEDQIGTVEDQ
jgi:hypothetical protein